jgi:hypothetical protein
VLLIGTQFSNLYTAVDTLTDTPASQSRVTFLMCVCVCANVIGVTSSAGTRCVKNWRNLSLEIRTMCQSQYILYVHTHTLYLVSDLAGYKAIMAIPYTGLSFAASCNSRSSHGQYTRSSTEHFQYGTVTSARLLGQNYRNRNYSKVRNYVLDINSFSNQTMAPRF